MDYSEKLKDPRWQKKRLEILERDGFCCKICYDIESTLHVHHKVYFHGKAPWEYEQKEMITLCEDCHKKEKQLKSKNKKKLEYLINIVFSQSCQDEIITSLTNRNFQFPADVVGGMVGEFMESPNFQDLFFRKLYQPKKSKEV